MSFIVQIWHIVLTHMHPYIDLKVSFHFDFNLFWVFFCEIFPIYPFHKYIYFSVSFWFLIFITCIASQNEWKEYNEKLYSLCSRLIYIVLIISCLKYIQNKICHGLVIWPYKTGKLTFLLFLLWSLKLTMSGEFKIVTADDIFRLPDVNTGMKILKTWGASIKGLKDKNSVQDALMQHWLSREETQREATDEVSTL